MKPQNLGEWSGRTGERHRAAVAGAVAASVYGIAYKLADPEHQATTGGFKFVFYMTGFAFAAVFLVVIKVLNGRADRKYREQLVAQAKVVK